MTASLFLSFMIGCFQSVAHAEEPASSTNADPLTEQGDESEIEPKDSSASEARTTVVVELSNGIKLTGTILTSDALSWEPGQPLSFIPESSTSATVLEAAKIKSVKSKAEPAPAAPSEAVRRTFYNNYSDYTSPGGFGYSNVGKSRHLYAPSSIGMKQGQGYYSQKFVFSAGAYGVTDNVTLLGGTFTFFPPLLTIVGGKVSGEVAENVHLSAGAEYFMTGIDGFTPLALVGFGGVTFGHQDRQVSLSSGVINMPDDPLGIGESAIPVVLSGQLRVSNRSVFVTENWLLMTTNQSRDCKRVPTYERDEVYYAVEGDCPFTEEKNQSLVLSLAYRLLGGRADTRMTGSKKWTPSGDPKITWDFGFIMLGPDLAREGLYGPLPWIDFAYHFGKPDR